MKTHAAALAVALGLALASSAQAYTGSYVPGQGINGTPHDLPRTDTGMNYTNPSDTLNRICIFCHAPHNTYRLFGTPVGAGPEAPSSDFDYLPLWNHTLEAGAYTMYENGPGAPQAGARASQAILNGMTPGSTSLLCLSCHDGAIAVNSYGNADQLPGSRATGTTKITSGVYLIGKDKYLGNHHPIGFNYQAAQADDNELRLQDTANLTPSSTIDDHLYGGDMECGTCHSVHNKGNTGETLLWRSDQNSELCLTCHNKGQYTGP